MMTHMIECIVRDNSDEISFNCAFFICTSIDRKLVHYQRKLIAHILQINEFYKSITKKNYQWFRKGCKKKNICQDIASPREDEINN